MKNKEKYIVTSGAWLKVAINWMFKGAIVGLFLGAITAAFGNKLEDKFAFGFMSFIGMAFLFAVVPIVISIWFLFLHTLWQTGRAVRGEVNEEE